MKAFISSTTLDLKAYREAVVEALERLGHQAGKMEVFGARPAGAQEVCRKEIKECDLFIGLYAYRYGFIPPNSQVSITEQEFDNARDLGKPTFCFIVDEDHPWPPKLVQGEPEQSKLKDFKNRIDLALVRDTFTTPDDLALKVSTSISNYLSTSKDVQVVDQPHLKVRRVQISAPARRVWDTLVDPKLLSKWVPFVGRLYQWNVEDANFIVKSPMLKIKSRLRVVEVERGRELHWVRHFPKLEEGRLSITYSFQIEPVDNATTCLLHDERFDGDIAELYWVLTLGGLIPRTLANNMTRRLKTLVEGSTATASQSAPLG